MACRRYEFNHLIKKFGNKAPAFLSTGETACADFWQFPGQQLTIFGVLGVAKAYLAPSGSATQESVRVWMG